MKYKLSLILLLLTSATFAQDSTFARRMVDTLTSKQFWGRGYTNDGMGKAAAFIAHEFKSYGIKPMSGKGFMQPFSFNVNTFPGKMELVINGNTLIPGRDFIVGPESKGVAGKGDLFQKDSVTFIEGQKRIVLTLKDKLTWSVSQQVADYTSIEIDKKALKEVPINVSVNIENKFVEAFEANNVCGLVKGTVKPDSVIIITAHYDHLGGMGKETYFPGANDNASGVSLLLSLAKYYAAHPQPYTMAFICFAGEEAGILGSKFFTENPLIPLNNVKFLVNTDLAGTGEDGITVVNATIYPKQFELLKQINAQGNYLVKVVPRGKAANSDHYWFTEKGVPAFFFYTMGGIKAYHDVFDVSKTLPLNKYNSLFKLMNGFVTALQQ
ncbi:M28 family metallopeptidase [Mucilaginibacter aquatilis]|uniref:M28 family peptidase n=1 Tax=Mucilaginibacter aquatilis TaxID=1517760 RepID=A0A6I4I7M7_9SPHI|nr:M28 family peptidase [Mucilaginibacter aquatilis]MVN90897.1 M28 family peptidase [Mucilaginibacter aquatilis]